MRRESKEALAQIMTGAGVSLIPTLFEALPGFPIDVDVVCRVVTRDGTGPEVVPLAIIIDEPLLMLLRPPEDWEVQHGDG